MNIQVGDRVTYKKIYKDEINIRLILNELYAEEIKNRLNNNEIEILKIERQKYEVVEEKRELLTEEEKEFLKQYIKILKFSKYKICLEKLSYEKAIIHLYIDRNEYNYIFDISSNIFIKLEINKQYTLSELGLED